MSTDCSCSPGCPDDQGGSGQAAGRHLARGGGGGLRLRHQLRDLQVIVNSDDDDDDDILQDILHVLCWQPRRLRLEVLKLLRENKLWRQAI